MIVSNLFYIDVQDLYFSEGDVCFELCLVLVVDENGMVDFMYIIDNVCQMLMFGGFLLLEYGWQQGEVVRVVFRWFGYLDVEMCCDYGGNECVICGCFML